MDNFEVNILGCGSALPTTKHALSAQVISLREKLYMVDCGEGTQLQFRKAKLNFNRLNHLFISHLHGDHCFGIPGLLSTLALLGRTGEIVIHAHSDAEKIFRPTLDYFCREMPYNVLFNSINPSVHALIYEDRTVKVYSIPLKHRIPSCGFLFEELPKSAHIIREMIDFYQIPFSLIASIKNGSDFVTDDGMVIPNHRLTRLADPPKKYAYCSDTAYSEKIIPIIEKADLLYHEATFAQQDIARAKETYHSSAQQAAMIARKAQVKQLLIGHFSARYPDENILLQEASEIFPQTRIATEYLKIKL
jgi:ribonuclease Z